MLRHLHSDASIIKHRKGKKKMCTVVIILYVIEYVCTSYTEKKKYNKSNKDSCVFELKTVS